ncbi:hypothetical protein GH714_033438 [Hevea brasiliensis]|uniref:Uncharacterized protein n=1 Tax=Hevea brasiliensis TaxID=3981 RepID=A0A6A6M7M4_HEVBR|nr:hypothetical protein GH714_033438 [Hevea brasiliensis]
MESFAFNVAEKVLDKVDPFLHLVDKKLKAVNAGSDHSTNIYGSKEDDYLPLKFLLEVDFTGDQSRGTLLLRLFKGLDNYPDSELSFVHEQLLNEFLPNDACQLAGDFMDALLKLDQVLNAEHQVGRMYKTALDLPHEEIAHHCETLLKGKQNKISNVMSA